MHLNEHSSAILGVEHTVGGGDTVFPSDQRSAGTGGKTRLHGVIPLKFGIDHGISLGGGQKLGTAPHHTAAGDEKLQAAEARSGGNHLQKLALAAGNQFDNRTRKFIGTIDIQILKGLANFPVDLLGDDRRTGNLKFIALAAHIFNENGKMQFSSSRNLQGIGGIGILHAQRDVGLQFPIQPLPNMTGGDVGALLACKGRGGNGEKHGKNGILDLHKIKPIGMIGIANGIPDLDIGNAGQTNDIARLRKGGGGLFQLIKGVNPNDLAFANASVPTDHGNRALFPNGSAEDLSHGHSARIVIEIDIGYHHLKGTLRIHVGMGDVLDDDVKKAGQITGFYVKIRCGPAVSSGGVNHGQIQLLLGSPQIDEKVIHFIGHLGGTGHGTVDLIHHDHRCQAQGQRFFQNGTGLGHTALIGIHQKDDTVHHGKASLHLPAEIGVAGGIHNIDLDPLVYQGGVFGQNGNASFFFQIVGIHNALFHLLIFTEGTRLLEHSIHQGGFSVVNVSNNGDVSDILIFHIQSLL